MPKFLAPEKGAAVSEAPPAANNPASDLVTNSVLYKEFLAEREEILRHKWLESEKAGHDIGFEKALLDWIVKHRSTWRERRRDAARHVVALAAAAATANHDGDRPVYGS